MENTTQTEERSYIAFISYRHTPLDREAATSVQKKIENYIVPKEFREQVGGKKLGLCFRDEDELPASSSLTDSIYYALDHTKFLIVICTPNLPLSKWCEAEVKYFLKTHDRDHILAVLADGDPSESFSPYMLHDFDEEGNILRDWEPLAAHIAGPNHTIDKKAFKKEIVRVYAALIGCPFDALWQRERRARTNRLLTAAGAAVAVMAIFLGVVLNRNAQIAAQNVQIQAQNDQITEQMGQIQEQNIKIEEQNTELQTQLSTVLVDSGITKLKAHDVSGALTDGVDALESNDPAIYDHRADKLLADALCAYQDGAIQSSVIYEQSQGISRMAVSDDESYVVFLDLGGVVRCMDLESYEILWEAYTDDALTMLYTENLGDRVLYKSKDELCCRSLKTGELLWSYEYQEHCSNYFQVITEDGTIFAVADRFGEESFYEDNPVYIVFLNTKDGTELGRTEMTRNKIVNFELSPILSEPEDYAASFTAYNRTLACILPAVYSESAGTESSENTDDSEDPEESEEEDVEAVFTIDLKTFERNDVGILHEKMTSLLGIDARAGASSIFFAGYSVSYGGLYTILATKNGDKYDYIDKITNHDLRATGGLSFFGSDIEFYDNNCHMLANDDCVLIFSDDSLFCFDREENQLMRSFSMTGTVTDAWWINDEKTSFEAVSSDGNFIQYNLGRTELFDTIFCLEGFDQDSFHTALPLNGGMLDNEESGMTLAIGGENKNQLLLSRFVTDPHRELIPFQVNDISYLSQVQYLEESKAFMIIHSGKSAFVFDPATASVTRQTEFEDYISSLQDALIVDEDHFLYEDKKYCMDGTSEDAGVPARVSDYNTVLPRSHIRLYDGSVLSWRAATSVSLNDTFDNLAFSYDDAPTLYCMWIDGELLEPTTDPETGLLLYDDFSREELLYAAAGGSGLFLGFGRQIREENGKGVIDEENNLYFYDVFTNTLTKMGNAFPDSGMITAAIGTKNQVACVLYNDGTVCVYDPAAGKSIPLDQHYSASEISAFGYSEGDDFLVLLTQSGRLDVYETGSYHQVFSEIIDSYHNMYVDYGTTFSSLLSQYSAEQDCLYVSAAYSTSSRCVFLDTSTWTVEAELSDVYAILPDEKKIYGSVSYDGVFVCPLYDTQDLVAWTKEALEK